VRGIALVSPAIVGLLLALAAGPLHAEVRVQGSADDVRIDARDATIIEILEALHAHFALHYRGTSSRRVTASYQGPLRRVLARLLDGDDYVIEPKGEQIEVIVVSSGTPRVAAPPAAPAAMVRRREH
jgi:hypothetical protein